MSRVLLLALKSLYNNSPLYDLNLFEFILIGLIMTASLYYTTWLTLAKKGFITNTMKALQGINNMNQMKVLCFDYYGTLVNIGSPFKNIKEWFEKF